MTKPESEDQGESDDDLDSGNLQADKIEERFNNNDFAPKSDLLEGRSGGHYWKHPLSNSLFLILFNEYIKN